MSGSDAYFVAAVADAITRIFRRGYATDTVHTTNPKNSFSFYLFFDMRLSSFIVLFIGLTALVQSTPIPANGVDRTINGDTVKVQPLKDVTISQDYSNRPTTEQIKGLSSTDSKGRSVNNGKNILAGAKERDYTATEGTLVDANGKVLQGTNTNQATGRLVGEAWGLMHGNGQRVTYDKNGNAVYGMLVDGQSAGVVRGTNEQTKYTKSTSVRNLKSVWEDKAKENKKPAVQVKGK
jgi:hypothetical protein